MYKRQDLIPPQPKIIVRAVRWLDSTQQLGDVLVHCALGLSRSSSVVACWLVWRGHATDIQKAITMIDTVRVGIVLSKAHEENIELALKALGHNA